MSKAKEDKKIVKGTILYEEFKNTGWVLIESIHRVTAVI